MARKQEILFLLERLKKSGTLTKIQIKKFHKYVTAAVDQMGSEGFRECSQAKIISILNISKDTMKNWIRKGCPSKVKNGREVFDPGKLLEWRWKYQQELDRDNVINQLAKDIQQEDLDLKRERRLKLEVDRRKKLRDLVPALDAWAIWRTLAQIIKANIEPLIEDPQILIDAILSCQNEFNKIIPDPSLIEMDEDLYSRPEVTRNKYTCKGRKNNGNSCTFKAKKSGYCLMCYNKLKKRGRA